MGDKIYIDKLECFGHHGILEEEKKQGQNFIVSVAFELDTCEAAEKDDCEFTVNYAEVCGDIKRIVSDGSCNLIETLARKIAEELIFKYNRMEKIEVRVDKPSAPIPMAFESVAVCTERSWHRAYIALGSNLGEPEVNIEGAVAALEESKFCRKVKASSLIHTKPYGPIEQPDFVNGAVELETILTPEELLGLTSSIENDFHRTRDIHWGPRTLDLDIIFYDDVILQTENLVIPHPEMQKRDFVLAPICELNRNLVHPIYNRRVSELLEMLKAEESYYQTC